MEKRISQQGLVYHFEFKNKNGSILATAVKLGGTLYVHRFWSFNSQALLRSANKELEKFAREHSCHTIKSDVVKNPRLLKMASRFGFKRSIRSYLGLSHSWKGTDVKTIAMHKRVK